jgi:predicted MPP superfamily phosphohydrolase
VAGFPTDVEGRQLRDDRRFSRADVNECVAIERGGDKIHVAGVDDPHFYRADNIEKASAAIPLEAYSILLTHTPEIYRQAAHAGFNLLLSGHTHGGQICLPGGIPITLDSVLPRRLGKGAWRHHDCMAIRRWARGCRWCRCASTALRRSRCIR